jgi:hypothetical protein
MTFTEALAFPEDDLVGWERLFTGAVPAASTRSVSRPSPRTPMLASVR